MYHLEMRVGVAEESDAKRAFLAKYLKSMKSMGMTEQNNNTKTKISTFFLKKKGREVRILFPTIFGGKENCCYTTHKCSGALALLLLSKNE